MKPGFLRCIGYFLAVGLLATITMDLTALLLVKSRTLNLGAYRIIPNLLGRWIGSLPRGEFFHSTILNSPPVSNEKVIGILSHYLIGLTLTSVLLFPYVWIWRRRIRLAAALLFGFATCCFPWFLMFPAMGFGMMALKTPYSLSLFVLSLLNHAAFGTGIFLWSNVVPVPHGWHAPPRDATVEPTTSLSHPG